MANLGSGRTVEDDVPRSATRSVRHFALHGERASSSVVIAVIVNYPPRLVSAEVGDEQLVASWNGYDLVRMRTLLAAHIGTRATELQRGALWRIGLALMVVVVAVGRIEEVRGRGGHGRGEDGPRGVLVNSKLAPQGKTT